MLKVNIRQLDEEDVRFYNKELTNLFNELHPDNQCLIDWFIWLKATGRIYGAFYKDNLIGMITAVLIPKPYAAPKNFTLQLEDVVVTPEHRGKGVGKSMVKHVLGISQSHNWAYKCILNCSDKNIPFYKKCGFNTSVNSMRIDL